MAKAKPSIIELAKVEPQPKRQSRLDRVKPEVKADTEKLIEAYNGGELEGVSVASLYRTLKRVHGEGVTFGFASFKHYLRRDG